ncbi:MAG: cupin domain-containing protein [Micromonosporaceae bacterium]|nr:cupin domain-containing protein [Micromonosporaceae bacterium]
MRRSEYSAAPLIENPSSGERIRIRTTAAESGGALLAWDLLLAPGGRVPSGHVHPGQRERFTVVEGYLRFRIGRRRLVLGPGQSLTVPPGTPHHFANAGGTEALVMVETRPAGQMQELLEVAAALAKGEPGRPRRIPHLVDLFLFMHEFRAEVRAPYLPGRIVRPVVRAIAAAAALVGADARYRRLRAR